MAKEKDNVLLWHSFIDVMLELTDEETKEVLRAFKAYIKKEPISFTQRGAEIAWKGISLQLDADKKKWDATCAKRAEVGRVGGLKSGNSRKQNKANEANAYFAKQNKKNEANEADTDTDTDINNNKENIYIKENEKQLVEGEPTPKPKSKRFVPPTIADIEAYCEGRTTTISATREGEKDIVIPLNKGYALDFFEFYENKEWKIGNQKMKSWQLAFMKWNRANYKRNQGGQKYGNANNRTSRNEGTYNELSDYSQFDE